MPHDEIADLLAAAFARVLDAMSAPISSSVSINPVRRGLSSTPGMEICEPGTISAAASGNAADDGSRGTSIAQASVRFRPRCGRFAAVVQRLDSISAPNALSMRSV
jgi:hypothetical protein